MSEFAKRWWPPIGGLIHAEPFFEWVMHTNIFKPFYRDHIVHQVRVAAIGDILLQQRVGRWTLLDRTVEALKKQTFSGKRDLSSVTKHPQKFVRLAWWLTALFHDCGYPGEYHQGIFKQLAGIYTMPLARPTTRLMTKGQQRPLTNLVDALEPRDIEGCKHGRHTFLGAAELAHEERQYELGPGRGERPRFRRRRQALFQLAAEAILSHHCPDKESCKTSFFDSPLGFLLILSDEIHEAGRPTARPSVRPSEKTIIEYQDNGILSIKARWLNRGTHDLRLTYRCRKGTERVGGKSTNDWKAEKMRTLKDSLLFGPKEVFHSIEVDTKVP
jgi:hypothetical protein